MKNTPTPAEAKTVKTTPAKGKVYKKPVTLDDKIAEMRNEEPAATRKLDRLRAKIAKIEKELISAKADYDNLFDSSSGFFTDYVNLLKAKEKDL